MKKTPYTIAISMGDPVGIGPELIASLAYDEALLRTHHLLCFGDSQALAAGFTARALAPRFTGESHRPGWLSCVEVTSMKGLEFGHSAAGIGRAQLSYFDAAITAVKEGRADALCTAPITKSIVDTEAGPFSGHTGYLGRYFVGRPVMLLASEELRVILLTEHIPLARVPQSITFEGVVELLQIATSGLRRDLGISHPRIAVAALNPHAGEEGHIGREEIEVLLPAVQEARSLLTGATLFDPAPADSLFTASARKRYDAVLCLYHDQGLIPLKALSARSAVNVTLGLDVVRTSPDHGTAYDIAGQGIADDSSLKRSIVLASEIVRNRAKGVGGR
jgi:4-hydroxythreonine-4-phosphate dehydrogenase